MPWCWVIKCLIFTCLNPRMESKVLHWETGSTKARRGWGSVMLFPFLQEFNELTILSGNKHRKFNSLLGLWEFKSTSSMSLEYRTGRGLSSHQVQRLHVPRTLFIHKFLKFIFSDPSHKPQTAGQKLPYKNMLQIKSRTDSHSQCFTTAMEEKLLVTNL